MNEPLPSWYRQLQTDYGPVMEALEQLGRCTREAGPLEDKYAHLVQLAAAAAVRSEGAVHSHARRALEAGATPEEVRHAVLLTTSTVGFPTASAAMSWVEDLLRNRRDFHLSAE